ncbi:cytochrome C [Magnetospirillum moscoviense]|uniref:Cytochrome C n=2 Tax=Magnetospirillum moscoviense TaxID=1437059 RepID=A0A178MJ83_9PROT|nr:cytochrome C [Magnetospirillum moscoviense]
MGTSLPQGGTMLAKSTFFALAALVVALVVGGPAHAAQDAGPSLRQASTADHSKFKDLQGPFASGPEVTKACLSCHTEAAKQVHKSLHWTWDYTNPQTGQKLGKKNIINNFCVSLGTNEPRCTSCHVGFGWKDDGFDFASEANVDCLVCHDRTGSYKKFPTDAGHPNYVEKQFPPGSGKVWPPADLAKVAQNVGPSSRQTCGACHFFGGGGDAVKHGDIDSSLGKPDKALDVHMDANGLNFTCATCHTTTGHITAGSRFATKAVDKNGIDVPGHTDGNRATCESCHGMAPHKNDTFAAKLNDHTDRVACPTCHVPTFARKQATKTVWDWSTAGKLKDGKPFMVKDPSGHVTYDSMKGDFQFAANVVPAYRWFNGDIKYTVKGEKIDDSRMVGINMLGGSAADPAARIWPFKEFKGRQPYDTVNKTLLMPHVFGKDENAFWGNFDWGKALTAGMANAGYPYSGQYGFIDSVYYWPITHMVAPKADAVKCGSCHSAEGRLKDVPGFYMPGRDRFAWLDLIGFGLAGLTLAGVVLHLVLRVALSRRGR